jgi:hypothetical protein
MFLKKRNWGRKALQALAQLRGSMASVTTLERLSCLFLFQLAKVPACTPGFDHEGFIALAGFMLAGNSDNIAFLFLTSHYKSPSLDFFVNVIYISRFLDFSNDVAGLQFRNLLPCLS